MQDDNVAGKYVILRNQAVHLEMYAPLSAVSIKISAYALHAIVAIHLACVRPEQSVSTINAKRYVPKIATAEQVRSVKEVHVLLHNVGSMVVHVLLSSTVRISDVKRSPHCLSCVHRIVHALRLRSIVQVRLSHVHEILVVGIVVTLECRVLPTTVVYLFLHRLGTKSVFLKMVEPKLWNPVMASQKGVKIPIHV